jgi:hypothetical protein
VKELYAAAGFLVLAQILGLYALWTRKADLVFTLVMVVLLSGAAVVGGIEIYHKVH